jgi:hypothetical protein
VSHFSGHFEGASTFLTPKLSKRGQKSLGPLKMSLETAQKVIVPQKKIYVPQFLKQRDINSYLLLRPVSSYRTVANLFNNYLLKVTQKANNQRDITNITKQTTSANIV